MNPNADAPAPRVALETSLGTIQIELDQERAPLTVTNFLEYVDEGFYNGTIFHRVIENFMIQGGGFTPEFVQKPTRPPVKNEADNGLKNARGTIAMARTSDPHSATAQFFINAVETNKFLDHTGKTPQGWGYCVFGRVVEGMDVIDQIRRTETGSRGGHQDVPSTPIAIRSAKRI
jgi:peptidyl-prolyl cis-trans isomerase B (cyclophilin B)